MDYVGWTVPNVQNRHVPNVSIIKDLDVPWPSALALLRENQHPLLSTAAIEFCNQVDSLIPKAHNELERLNSLIAYWTARRDVIAQNVDSYQSLHAPVRTVPAELLEAVFRHVCTTPVEIGQTITIPALSLSHVCSYWRRIVPNIPELWTRISIESPSLELLQSGACQRALETVLWHSRDHFIEIRICLLGEWLDNNQRPALNQMLGLLEQQSHRWRSVQIVGPDWPPANLKLDNLVSLSLGKPVRSWNPLDTFSTAPKLSRVTLYDFAPLPVLPYEELQSLRLKSMPICKALEALYRCNQLVEFHIVQSKHDDDRFGPWNQSGPGQLHLPTLTSFSMTDIYPGSISQVFSCFTFPNLKSFTLGFRERPGTVSTIRSLILRSSPQLESLCLKHVRFYPDKLENILELIPSLRRLSIEEHPTQALLTNTVFRLMTHDGNSQLPSLVPHLAELELHTSMHFFYAQELLEMLKSRHAAATPSLRNFSLHVMTKNCDPNFLAFICNANEFSFETLTIWDLSGKVV